MVERIRFRRDFFSWQIVVDVQEGMAAFRIGGPVQFVAGEMPSSCSGLDFLASVRVCAPVVTWIASTDRPAFSASTSAEQVLPHPREGVPPLDNPGLIAQPPQVRERALGRAYALSSTWSMGNPFRNGAYA
jgi:hypothetical protein